MKRTVLVTAIILVVALLTGTAFAAQMENGVLRAGEGAGEGLKILLLQQHRNNAFQNGVYDAAVKAAEELKVDLTVLSSDSDAATQISQIEQGIGQYDAILFEPVNPDALGAAAKEAADAGVVVINIISACTDWENYGIAALSCGDNVTAGETEMQAVADLIGGKGKIAILTGPSGDSGGLQRLEGYRNILANYPEIEEVVEPADCGWDTASAQTTVESWLSAYEFDAIVAENDGMAIGAGNAAGANSGIVITGVDGTPDGFEAIKDGRITGTVSQNGGEMAANGINAAVLLIKGETLESNTLITTNTWIDASNIADFE